MTEVDRPVIEAMDCRPFRAAAYANRYFPRGKGAVPRWLGRLCKPCNVITRTARGAALLFPNNSWDMAAHFVNQGGRWNEAVIVACITSLDPGQVFLDIGANIGVVSVEVSAHFGGDIACLAFEPQALLAETLIRSAELNGFGSLHVHQVALGSSVGDVTLFEASHNIHVSRMARERGARSFNVTGETLDHFLMVRETKSPSAIKVDVEGGELLVFKGASQLIAKSNPSIIFESDENMRRWGNTRSEVINYLAALAPYRFYVLNDEGLPVQYEHGLHDDARNLDIVATCRQDFLPRYQQARTLSR